MQHVFLRPLRKTLKLQKKRPEFPTLKNVKLHFCFSLWVIFYCFDLDLQTKLNRDLIRIRNNATRIGF